VANKLGRTPKQCQERYANYLNPSLIKTPLTMDEMDKIRKMYHDGSRLSTISRSLNRSLNCVKNFAYREKLCRGSEVKDFYIRHSNVKRKIEVDEFSTEKIVNLNGRLVMVKYYYKGVCQEDALPDVANSVKTQNNSTLDDSVSCKEGLERDFNSENAVTNEPKKEKLEYFGEYPQYDHSGECTGCVICDLFPELDSL
jgi:hypothetical protein